MLIAFVLAGIVLGWMRGGRLRDMEVELVWPLLPVAAFLLERLLPLVPGVPARLPQAALYALLLVFFFKNRWGGAWALLCGGGTALNALVIGANGWRMPVTARVTGNFAKLLATGRIPGYTLAGAQTRFLLLGDILPVPGVGYASVGDLLMGVGAALLVSHMMTAPARRQGASPGPGKED